jgi:hypothetical protein
MASSCILLFSGSEVRNVLVIENCIVWATMSVLWLWIYLHSDEDIHRHRHLYFLGGPLVYVGSFALFKVIFWVMSRSPPEAELDGLVKPAFYKGRGWKLTPAAVPLVRCDTMPCDASEPEVRVKFSNLHDVFVGQRPLLARLPSLRLIFSRLWSWFLSNDNNHK